MKRWSYWVRDIAPDCQEYTERVLDELGNDGWELVAAIHIDRVTRFFLKREVSEGEAGEEF